MQNVQCGTKRKKKENDISKRSFFKGLIFAYFPNGLLRYKSKARYNGCFYFYMSYLEQVIRSEIYFVLGWKIWGSVLTAHVRSFEK